MALITLNNIKIAFGGPELIDNAGLQIDRRERVCLVGRNGAGKSTLLRIIASEVLPDSGELIKDRSAEIAFLDQQVPLHLKGTVFDVVAGGLGSMVGLITSYHDISSRLSRGQSSPELLAELEQIQHKVEASGGWQLEQKVETVLSKLKLDPDSLVSDLSGGYKRKVLLAKALVSDPDLLLLDEPTNHLDMDSISWLEEFLLSFGGALLFVTHDRRFLQTLATRIIELDRGRLTDWPGDYNTYMTRRQAELDAEAAHDALFDKKLKKEEAWIRQGIKARRTRNEGRVRALKDMRRERQARRQQAGSVSMNLNEAERSGRLVIEAENISHAYNGKQIITDFSTTILRGDRIGIIGPNGSGKTTLLNLLLGTLTPQKGSVRLGTRLQTIFFDQHRSQLDDEKSVVENVGDGYEHVTINGRTRHIIGYLEDFLFPPERSRSPVRVLSGGERNRALLAKLFTKPSNLLIMDEPTNDLDTDTLELLEELLMEYEGTVIVVSHDREFLNNVVTSTIVFEGSGRVAEYVGGYDDWLQECRRRTEAHTGKNEKQEKIKTADRQRSERSRPRTLTFNEKKELAGLPERIDALEKERDRLYNSLADPEFYRQNGEEMPVVRSKIEALEKEIAEAYDRWALLDSIPEA